MEVLKTINEKRVSRRTFLKGLGALGAMSALYGCGDTEEATQSVPTEAVVERAPVQQPTPPPITEEVFPGAAPHNCGGRCVTKAYVKDGVITRIVTDERPDKNLVDGTGDNPQRRACLRCRSYKQRLYRSDRLTYPMKQTKERGDLDGFVRITWEEAFTEIAEKMQAIKDQYGSQAFYNHYASGDGAAGIAAPTCSARLLNLFGGAQVYRSDYSWPSIEHMSWFALGQNKYFPSGNSQGDVTNAELLIAWSNNYGDLIWGTNSMWYMQQAKEMGVEIIAIEARQTNTVSTLADNFIPVIPGTDPTVLLAVMYVMLEENLLDKEFVKKYVHGFFDDPEPALYHGDVDNKKYIVPAGASLAAYLIGNNAEMVDGTYIQAASIYPDEIYYNVNEDDVLFGKSSFCYGQTPKTPEWAEKISGVKADTIRELARKWATKKTTVLVGGGWQRQSEGEQVPWLIYVMGGITGNFGESGRNVAMNNGKAPVAFGGMPAGTNPVPGELAAKLYDAANLTAPAYTPAITRASYPVFLWSDVAKNGGTGKSDWNDGQVKRMPVGIKCLFNFGGNALINQHGDANRTAELLKDKSKIELIVLSDQFLTPSARYADYVLPAAMSWERNNATTTWVVGDNVIFMNKAIDPPGEAMQDYDIVAGIADKLGLKDEYTEGKEVEDWLKETWEATEYAKSMPYEDWKKEGIYVTSDENTPPFIEFKAYREDPATNPLYTPSGKFEAYSQALVEDYEARGYNNLDDRVTLGGTLHDKKNTGRFVYPIPMYIPILEGRHADGSHPDPSGVFAKGYTFQLMAPHHKNRSHSTHNNNAYLNELFKKDKDGNPAFLNPNREMGQVWDDNVYEPVWMNPEDASALGVKDGNRVLLSNDRGKVYASVYITNRAMPGVLWLGQGAWYDPASDGIDRGGCPNTLTKQRPARICQGMTLGSDTLVSVKKA
ncbi:anaerobic dimethyl sulfoxide reductase subunit A [Anaerolineales bacterium]|nr:anaerobic dimethyl sulfoxide reductase subunit A [Anaerolineales bacterium]